MGIKTYRPTTPARRYFMVATRDEITRTKPHESLLRPLPKTGGRNNTGRKTNKWIGGGEKQQYRVIDFLRDKTGIAGKVVSVEYDPNRSSLIALVCYADGEYRYILCPQGLKVGDTVSSGTGLPIREGNAMPLSDVPVGVEVHNLQLYPRSRSFLVRSAGTAAQLLNKEENMAVIQAAVRRDPAVSSRLHGDYRASLQLRAQGHLHRQSRALPAPRHQAGVAGSCHESD